MSLIPPQAIDMEQAVLGAILSQKGALLAVIDRITEDSFYNPIHALIYKAVINLDNQSKPVDILTVCNELKEKGALEKVGGAHYLATLTNQITSTAHIVTHALIVAEKAMLRDSIKHCTNAIQTAYENAADPFQIIDNLQVKLLDINRSVKKGLKPMSTLTKEMFIKLEQTDNDLTGIHTSFNTLDILLGGWQKSDLIILAARPGMGKTALMRRIAASCVLESKKCCAIFSLEMSSLQLTQRFYAADSGVYYSKFKKNELNQYDWDDLNRSSERLMKANLYIDDTAAIKLQELRSKCIKLKQEKGLEMVMIDYLTLMQSNNKGNREQEVAEISRGLKAMAKDLDITVIALAQLSRKVEERADKRPLLSDLRESGQIEQDADVIIFMMRPEYYNFNFYDFPDIGESSTQGRVIVDVAKNRNGNVGAFTAQFIGETMDFKE